MTILSRMFGAKGHGSREVDLDVIRGVAILLAMGWHVNRLGRTASFGSFLLEPGSRIGWAGVDLFFALSGFLIGGMILREYKKTGGFAYGTFLFRRVFRLWPTLYVFLIAMLLFGGFDWRDFFWQAALHVQNYVHTASATHLWSLAVEEHFYVLLGVLIPWVVKHRPLERWLPQLLIVILLSCPVLRLMGVEAGKDPVTIQTATHFRLDALGSGVLLSYIAWRSPGLFDALLKLRVLWATIVIVVVSFLWNTAKDSELGQVVGYSASWVGAVSFILLVYRSGIEQHARWTCRAIAFLGQVSYPLYLWHVPVARMTEKLAARVLHGSQPGLVVVAIYCGSIAAAFLMSVGVEHPFMRLRDVLVPARVTPVVSDGTETMHSF